jgi:hypothetical protein
MVAHEHASVITRADKSARAAFAISRGPEIRIFAPLAAESG